MPPNSIIEEKNEHAVEHPSPPRRMKPLLTGDSAKILSHSVDLRATDLAASPLRVVSDESPSAEFYSERQKMERERLIGAIAQHIRRTLDFNDLVAIAAQELGKLLAVDRVEIVQYHPELGVWRHVAEYCCDPHCPSFMQQDIPDHNNALAVQLRRLEVVHIPDALAVLGGDPVNKPYVEMSPGSWLLLPIAIESRIWGSLSLVKQQTGGWDATQIDLCQAAVEQLAIAIEHAQLYQQVSQLNRELERTVQQRTLQLSQALASESMLKRITDKVRDTLDEHHILQTAVDELARLLELNYCDTGLYDPQLQTCTIVYDYTAGLPSAQGKVIQITQQCPEIYHCLLCCHPVHFCLLPPTPPKQATSRKKKSTSPPEPEPAAISGQTILACPIFDNQGVLGDLWLFRPADQTFDDLEIRLVQQVTNQCAIAIRQARLYQAAQQQVEALEHISQLKDTFLSTVSHELRTPISSIKMAIQMLTLTLGREGLLPDPSKPSPSATKITHYLKILNDECNREIGLISDLLDLQQLEAGTHCLTVQPIELSSYLHRILRPFEAQVAEHQRTLLLDIPPSLPLVLSDPQSLERILVELLTNACKYTPSGETISVSAQVIQLAEGVEPPAPVRPNVVPTRSQSDRVVIRVTNSGAEISPEQLGRIFDKFYRIPNSDPHRHGGTGLGLALVKKLAMRIGGQVSADSSAGMTSFTIELPKAE